MEKNIQQIAREALVNQKVSGFLCTDSTGLCLAAEGVASEKWAGIIATIASLAARLEPGDQQQQRQQGNGKFPVISIESASTKIIIQTRDQLTTAICRKAGPSGQINGLSSATDDS